MGHVRVLVVDDDAAVRRSLSTALGRDGYEVVAADGGSAALARLAAGSVDAIVLDVAMPEPNGLEVCRRLRARGDRTPVLMLTARDLVDDRVAGLDAGADDYLVKPFALAELRARLRALLRRNAASTPCGGLATSCGMRRDAAEPGLGGGGGRGAGRRGRGQQRAVLLLRGEPAFPRRRDPRRRCPASLQYRPAPQAIGGRRQG